MRNEHHLGKRKHSASMRIPNLDYNQRNYPLAQRELKYGEKRPLKIDMDELRSAIEDNSYEHEYYLDLVTAEIIYFSEYVDDEERGKLRDRIDDNPSHYEQIPKEEPREGYENMRAFIATLDNKHLVELLEVAINGKGAFPPLQGCVA